MKKPSPSAVFIISIVCVLTVILALFSGCDLFAPKYDYNFVNESSYDLTVTPDGQTSWTSFVLVSQTSKSVAIPETTILFTFDQSALVKSDTSVQGSITFTDIPLYAFVFNNYSTHSITLTPDGQTSWTAVTLSPNGNKTITIPETLILFTYDNAGYVDCDTTTPGAIDFRNKTMLTIKNMTSSSVIDFVNWNGVYFGKDLVWDAVLGMYVYGMVPGGFDTKEVSPGTGYVYFWFAAGGPEYRTVSLVSVSAEEQKEFVFVDSTTVMPLSLTGTIFNIDEGIIVPDTLRTGP